VTVSKPRLVHDASRRPARASALWRKGERIPAGARKNDGERPERVRTVLALRRDPSSHGAWKKKPFLWEGVILEPMAAPDLR
jgi:hypothetical protein